MTLYRLARRLPALEKLSALELEFVLSSFSSYRFSRRSKGFRFIELGFVVVVMFSEIVGLIGGWVCWRGLLGSVIGALLAMSLAMVAGYCVFLYALTLQLRRFLKSDQAAFLLRHTKGYETFILRREQESGRAGSPGLAP